MPCIERSKSKRPNDSRACRWKRRRSHRLLIRLGYVLVGVVAVAGLYKVFSPKDPLVSAERILMPWADIVPASRVAIRGRDARFA